jgi:hypothetical protein
MIGRDSPLKGLDMDTEKRVELLIQMGNSKSLRDKVRIFIKLLRKNRWREITI